jgi:extradiol dioxygenase family protein
MRPFHLAIPVIDLEKTRIFYTQILGCSVGRESDRWIDFNFKGHQVTGHLVSDLSEQTVTNQVDEQSIPVRHFGLILVWNE